MSEEDRKRERMFSLLINEVAHTISLIYVYSYYIGELSRDGRKKMVIDAIYAPFAFIIDLIRYLENINYKQLKSDSEVYKYLTAAFRSLETFKDIIQGLFRAYKEKPKKEVPGYVVTIYASEGENAAVSGTAYLSRVLEILRHASRVIKRAFEDYIAFNEEELKSILDKVYEIVEKYGDDSNKLIRELRSELETLIYKYLENKGLYLGDPDSSLYRNLNAFIKKIASIRRW